MKILIIIQKLIKKLKIRISEIINKDKNVKKNNLSKNRIMSQK